MIICHSIQQATKMAPTCSKSPSTAAILMLILFLFSHEPKTTEASGVFELEFISLQRVEPQPIIKLIEDSEPIKSTSTNNDNRTNNSETQTDFIQIFVCLKEAFTSQLDGPCTFGNASITLNRDSMQPQQEPTTVQQSIANSKQQQLVPTSFNSSQQQQQGSLMTNLVRILFTFRWTKSFTIILTAEQIDANSQQQHPVTTTTALSQRSVHKSATNPRYVGSVHQNGTNSVELPPISVNRSRSGEQLAPATQRRPQFIDRHVLTENEVLPNLEPNLNKPWANRFSRSLKTSLAYRFRIYCSLNYYGDGCTTFCRPRDDQFGHYNCSSTGQKVCLDGWHGPDCDRAKCRSGCNQQHGYCDKPDTCECRPGWTGARCDECITYPGCQNGYCLSPWQCICQRNWGGVLCDQDLNVCGTRDPCKNNGTCQNIAPGKYKCDCPNGFTGVDCDINLSSLQATAGAMTQLSSGCALNPCLNGGACFGFNGQPVGPSALNLDGEVSHQIYRCQCPAGWTGDYCQWSELNSLPVTIILPSPINATEKQPFAAQKIANASSLSPPPISSNVSEQTTTEPTRELESYSEKYLPLPITLIETTQSTPITTHLELKHLISGVVIASVIGVFLASLLLAWCCLMAIERNRFPFIQMNIIRNADGGHEDSIDQHAIVSSTLRRMHAKIRDSLRRSSRARIKPETKLSIENVLRPPKPPPSYDESSNYHYVNKILIEYPPKTQNAPHSKYTQSNDDADQLYKCATTKQSLVIKEANDNQIAPSKSSAISIGSGCEIPAPITAGSKFDCPRHGHLYRKQQQQLIAASKMQFASNSPNQINKQLGQLLNHYHHHMSQLHHNHNHSKG